MKSSESKLEKLEFWLMAKSELNRQAYLILFSTTYLCDCEDFFMVILKIKYHNKLVLKLSN